MKSRIVFSIWMLISLLLACGASPCRARDLSKIDPPYPRIANCYGAGLGWKSWNQGSSYWSKVGLFIGGGYDLHYDWDNPRWTSNLAILKANAERLRQVNPNALILAYVDVVEAPDNPAIPKGWWALNAKGERWSDWPGYYRINTSLTPVLPYNLDKVRSDVFARSYLDGVFYDCWSPDDWLVPRTAQLAGDNKIVMLNAWNLPDKGFHSLNGVLAEDEINRVIEGKIRFSDFLALYLKWCAKSRKPVTTTLVCHPESIDDNAWRWSKLTPEERASEEEKGRANDQQTMRFGLTTALLGDGYFAYDAGTMARGNWWWYKEYDAPLGYPKGPAKLYPDGTWRREFDGGLVVVNGSHYDIEVKLPGIYRDVSTGRVNKTFTLPMFDGRILLPSKGPVTETPDVKPLITANPPKSLLMVHLPQNRVAVQTPTSLELRFKPDGEMSDILWRGHTLMTGGFPIVAAPPFNKFSVSSANNAPADVVDRSANPAVATLHFNGTFTYGDQRADYTETCTVQSDSQFTLHYDFTAETDLDIRMWRQYFDFPVSDYSGQVAKTDTRSAVLPGSVAKSEILPWAKSFIIETKGVRVIVRSSADMTLTDDRNYGSQDYMLAAYPIDGKVMKGAKWSYEVMVSVQNGDG